MSQATGIIVGAPVALGAAASFGVSSILQYRATHRVPKEPVGRPRLLLDLARQRDWRWSVILAIAAFGLQVLALKFMPLILVQPLLVTGLLWYVVLSAVLDHRRPDRVLVLGSSLALASLSAFLILASPTQSAGHGLDSLGSALPLGIGLAAVLALCLGLAAVVDRAWRSLPIALATGVLYGATAGLVRSLSQYFGSGLGGILGHWQTYAIIVIAPLGVLLSQNAYQAGKLGSPALAIMTVTDPLVGIAIGLVWLNEKITMDTAHLTGEAISLITLIGAVFLLARRAPHVQAGVAGEPPDRHDADGGTGATGVSGGSGSASAAGTTGGSGSAPRGTGGAVPAPGAPVPVNGQAPTPAADRHAEPSA